MSDPLWYKDAIIYEVHVRGFYDSNADGIGDFPGLTEKLPYLHDLGVTCLWLLPFYPSPLRDDGYDIAEYTSINPIYGTLDDFRRFVDAAHALQIRVLTELVINHTSDQHPWFQRARRAPKGFRSSTATAMGSCSISRTRRRVMRSRCPTSRRRNRNSAATQ